MGTACCKDRSVTEKVEGSLRATQSLKRMKSKRLVGVSQFALDPEARAKEEFPKADIDKNGTLSIKEVRVLLKRLNAYMPKRRLQQLFDEADVNKDGELNLAEFQTLFAKADERPTLQKLFREADQLRNDAVSALNLHEFFKRTAPDDEASGWKVPSVEECGKLIQRYSKSGSKKSDVKQMLTFDQFRKVFNDPETNHICDPERLFGVYQDMDRPLSHYYVSSSHNSYLSGAQTRGTSTPDAIRRALELGVRVIELDVWNGQGEPMVTHGHAFCTQTSFKGCIEVVAKYAFVASQYPVILTIENHCTKEYQTKMAKILSSILGDKLYRFQDSNVSREKLFKGPEEWVTPRDLIGKVVIRDKPKKMVAKKDDHAAHVEEEEVEPDQSTRREQKKSWRRKARKDDSDKDMELQVSAQADPKKKGGLLRSMFAKNTQKSADSADLITTSSNETSNRTLGVSVGVGTVDSSLDQNVKKEQGQSERRDSNRSLNNDDEDDEEDPNDFIDDQVENEGLGDKVAAKVEEKKREFEMSMAGSIRFAVNAVNKLGLLTEDTKLRDWLKEPPTPKDLPTNSVAQLLEIVYIKNVKMKIREERSKRPSMKNAFDSSGRFNVQDYKLIHVTYPEWKSSSSISEARMLKFTRPGPRVAALSTYARHHILRSYPAGTRVGSDNYDPCPAWNAGIQIVALNYQTNGKPIWLSQGKFADNGACGWVLKPKKMMEARSCGRDTPEEEEEVGKEYWDLIPKATDPRGDRLTVTILSAHYLPKPLGSDEVRSEIIDPFVEVHLCGYERDEATHKTKYVDDNGFNPEFNEKFTFTMRQPDLDLLMFIVKDKDTFKEDFIAQNCFPVQLVRPGYRVVPLRRADSSPIPDAFLFVHIQWEREVVAWN